MVAIFTQDGNDYKCMAVYNIVAALFLLPHKKALLYTSRTAGLCRFLILFKDYNPSYVEYGDIAGAKIRRNIRIPIKNSGKTRNYL